MSPEPLFGTLVMGLLAGAVGWEIWRKRRAAKRWEGVKRDRRRAWEANR